MKKILTHIGLLACISAPLFAAPTDSTEGLQDMEKLEQQVRAQVMSLLQDNPKIRSEIKVDKPDSRLKLTQCEQDLSFITHERNPASASRINMGVKCEGSTPWTLYVPVEIFRYGKVAVSTQVFRRGDEINASQVEWVERRLEDLPQGYLLSSEQINGQRAARHLRMGSVITPSSLKPAFMVKKGEQVTIEAILHGITIHMAGKAISDGVIGQTINVKNLSSERIVQATVVDAGKVAVRL